MIEKIKNLDDFKEEDSVFFLENLPADSYKTHKVIIDQLNTKILKVLNDVSFERLLASLFGIYNSGCEVPFKFIFQIDALEKDFLKKLSPVSLFNLAKILSSKNQLSEDMGRNIIDL